MGSSKPHNRKITAADKAAAKRLSALWEAKRKMLGLTQERLAADYFDGRTQGLISQYLRGKIALGPVATLRFARALGVEPTDIRPDFEFNILPTDLPSDVIEIAIKLSALPPAVREDFGQLIDTISTTGYNRLLTNLATNGKQPEPEEP